jgi:hypothetical protein
MDQQERQAWRDLANASTHHAERAAADGRTGDAAALREQATDATKAARTGRRPGR